jgi:GNAT superfamily N-acetyltransferase
MSSKSAIARVAELEDAEPIAVLCEQLGYPTSTEEVRDRLLVIKNDEEHVVYVAQLASGAVVGWIHAHICNLVITPPQALLLGIVVERSQRYGGIGRLLMQKIEQWAEEKSCQAVLVRSNIIRQEAHVFYEKIGYQKTKQSLVFTKILS